MADMTAKGELEVPGRIRSGIVAVLVVTVLLATLVTFFGTLRFFERQAVADAERQLSLYLRSLNETLKQHQHLPYILANNDLIRTQVERGAAEDLNTVLADFAEAANLEAIYVMSLAGDVIAASNAGLPTSFMGQNYGFRPYFREAAAGHRSDYFAIGATTGRPGYFVAEPLRSVSGDIVGVMAIKLDISELQASWEERGEAVFASNGDGVVVLSADPAWLYRDTTGLDPARREEIVSSRQFGAEPLERLFWAETADGRVTVEGEVMLRASEAAEWRGWTVHYLLTEREVYRQTLTATALMGTFIAALILFATFLRSRRIAAALATSQRQRGELVAANAKLVEAQEELARTSKLAALGQLAASVTHELGQPISALKNHLTAAEIGNEITSPETASNLRRLADRMEAITQQLRFFSRRDQEAMAPTDLRNVIQEALALLRHDFEASGVTVDYQKGRDPVILDGHRIQLEQAMVNILRNALHAVEEGDDPRVTIDLTRDGTTAHLEIRDNGPGLNGKSLDELQEPFFSTKSSGVGMGLGLSITTQIIRSHGGQLSAQNGPLGGAVFLVTLPLAEGRNA